MIFSTGSTFIFRSWIYQANDKGKLQRCLLEDQENQKDHTLSMRLIKELVGRLSRLTISESIQVSPMIEFNLEVMPLQEAAGSVRGEPLTGAQEGLVLTMTP
jgi:hypothetical protein